MGIQLSSRIKIIAIFIFKIHYGMYVYTSLFCFTPWVWSDSFGTPLTAAHQAPLFMGSPRQESWSGLPFPSPGDLPDPGIKPGSPALQAYSQPTELPRKPTMTIRGGKRRKEFDFLKLKGFIQSSLKHKTLWYHQNHKYSVQCLCLIA